MSGEELEGETRASEPDGKRGRPCLNGDGRDFPAGRPCLSGLVVPGFICENEVCLRLAQMYYMFFLYLTNA